MTRYRKPFYANEMHNDSNFSVHRYFTSNEVKVNKSILKEFVDLPCPFGIQNTYNFLRKTNLKKLPFLTQTKQKKSKSTFNSLTHHTAASKRHSLSRSSIPDLSRTIESLQETKKSSFLVKVCMYDQIDQISNFNQYCIDLDMMKFVKDCFLKCKLQLENISLQQYKQIQRWILPTLRYRSRKGRELQSPLVLLGVLEMKTKDNLIQKIRQFEAQGKTTEIYQLIEYFFIPEDQIMEHQLEMMIQSINKAYKYKKVTSTNTVSTLFLMDGTPIECLFQILTNNPLVIGAPLNVKSEQLKLLRESLKNQIRQQERNSRQSWMKSVVKADRSIDSKKSQQNSQPKRYYDIDQSLKKRRSLHLKIGMKDKYSLMRSKGPFMNKQDLVHQHDIFRM